MRWFPLTSVPHHSERFFVNRWLPPTIALFLRPVYPQRLSRDHFFGAVRRTISIRVLMLRVTCFGIVTVAHLWTAERNDGASSPPLAAIMQDAAGGLTFAARALMPDKAAIFAAILSNFMAKRQKKSSRAYVSERAGNIYT